jgi:hypothetical protein
MVVMMLHIAARIDIDFHPSLKEGQAIFAPRQTSQRSHRKPSTAIQNSLERPTR